VREGYKRYSDGLWRRVYQFDKWHSMMQVRTENGKLIATFHGTRKIKAALAEVQKAQSDDEKKEKSVAQRLHEPG
jgi:myosin-crossreactive antigen